jgi:hypothetical protein
MKKTAINLSLALALSSYSGCWAADTTAQPPNEFEKNASNAMQNLGAQADKAGHAITTSVNDLGRDAKSGTSSKQMNDFEKNASNGIKKLGDETDNAGKAFASSVKGVGNKLDSMDKNQRPQSTSSSSGNHSLDELGKNVNKTGAAMETSMKKMGKQASDQMAKAQHSVASNNKKPASKNAAIVRRQQTK